VLPAIGIAAAGPRLLARLEPAALRREREQLVAELPLVLDLLAACLAGGASLPTAAAAVAAAVPGPYRPRLQAVVDALAVGTAPGEAWLALGGTTSDDPVLPVARLLSRGVDGGTPLAAALARMAAEARAAARAAGATAARRVGVLIVAPLGLCFLPAFVLIGIVPVVAGLAAPLLATF
jgi:pilus assembly protein TadC